MQLVLILIHVLLITIGAYQAVDIFYKQVFPPDEFYVQTAAQKSISDNNRVPENRNTPRLYNYAIISKRNLFDVALENPIVQNDGELPVRRDLTPPKSELQILLWGTVVTESGTGGFAVVENQKNNTQGLFEPGDTVAEGAVVKKIYRNRVILEVNGQEQMLEVDLSQIPATESTPMSSARNFQESFIESSGSLENQMNDPQLIKDQLAVRPSFVDGQPSGLFVFGIKDDSIYHGLGLRNGDIIQSVNGIPTLTGQDENMIYQSVKNAVENDNTGIIRFIFLRKGKKNSITYSHESNTFQLEKMTDALSGG